MCGARPLPSIRTQRQAIVLVAGDKSGTSEKRFYKQLIKKADERFDNHLTQLQEEEQ
ncbi:toxin-antitoxin system, toxin component, RelE domain protein [Tolypothrix sp. PCC 7601]|nr:toxin-antitoxin system, toxin component, RelE domain protein [Tolypothrix sp. PCC 7601]